MTVAVVWRHMQELHSLEAGAVSPSRVQEVGWVHAMEEARQARTGRTAEQVIRDWQRHLDELQCEYLRLAIAEREVPVSRSCEIIER